MAPRRAQRTAGPRAADGRRAPWPGTCAWSAGTQVSGSGLAHSLVGGLSSVCYSVQKRLLEDYSDLYIAIQ